MRLSRSHYRVASLAALGSFGVYLLTLGPTVTGEDSGELVAAAYTLGIPHPPGYPLWCLLGKLFITALPFGSVAWRVNLMSAFWASSTVFLVCLLIIKLTGNRLAGLAGALALGFSTEFWEQSVIAEVYTLNAFFVVLCTLLLFSWYESRREYLLHAFALTYGLSLCNHQTMYLLGPVFLLFIVWVDRKPWRRWKVYATMLLPLALGLSVYLYLPMRSRADPPMDWGNPETLQAVWDVVTRKQYRYWLTNAPRSVSRHLAQAWVFLEVYSEQFTPWLAWLPLLGALGLWRKERLRLLFLLALFLVVSVGFILIPNFDIDPVSIWLTNVFWIPSYVVAAVLVGAAIDASGSIEVRGHRLTGLSGLLASACVILPLSANYHRNDKSDYYFAYDFGMNVLETLDPGAIYFSTGDHETFPALYLQVVEGLRPDVEIANKYGYLEEGLYADMAPEVRRQFRMPQTRQQRDLILEWIIARGDRPVYFTRRLELPDVPKQTMVNAGLLYRVASTGEGLPERDAWAEYAWHTTEVADTRGELTAELVVFDYYFAKGRYHLEKGETEKALEYFARIPAIAGKTERTLNNVADHCAEHGLYGEAESFLTKALELEPDNAVVAQNLAVVRFVREDYAGSLAVLQELLAQPGEHPGARRLAARCYRKLGRVEDALAQLHALARATPRDDTVFRELGMIYLNEKGDRETAQRMFSLSLSINPNQPDLAASVGQ